MNRPRSMRFAVLLLLSALFFSPAFADEPPKPADPATEQRLEELEQKVDDPHEGDREPADRRDGSAAPSRQPLHRATAPPALGLGPAASKVVREEGRLDRRVRRDPLPELLGLPGRRDARLEPDADDRRRARRPLLRLQVRRSLRLQQRGRVRARRHRERQGRRDRGRVRDARLAERKARLQRARRPRAHPRRARQPAPRAAGRFSARGGPTSRPRSSRPRGARSDSAGGATRVPSRTGSTSSTG